MNNLGSAARLFIISLLLCVVLSLVAHAATYVEDNTYGTGTGGASFQVVGSWVTINTSDLYLLNVTYFPPTSSSFDYVINESGVLLCKWASGTQTFCAVPVGDYFVGTGNDATAYLRSYNPISSPPFPIVNDVLTWVHDVYVDNVSCFAVGCNFTFSANSTAYIENIKTITLKNLYPPVMGNVTLLPSTTNNSLFLYANATGTDENVTFHYNLTVNGAFVTSGVVVRPPDYYSLVHTFSITDEGEYVASVFPENSYGNNTAKSSNFVDITFPSSFVQKVEFAPSASTLLLILFIVFLIIGIITLRTFPYIIIVSGIYNIIYGAVLVPVSLVAGLVVIIAFGIGFLALGMIIMLG